MCSFTTPTPWVSYRIKVWLILHQLFSLIHAPDCVHSRHSHQQELEQCH